MAFYRSNRVYVVNPSLIPIPIELHPRRKTEMIHTMLTDIFQHIEFVTVSDDADALEIRAPSLSQLLLTTMNVVLLLKAKKLEGLVSIQ